MPDHSCSSTATEFPSRQFTLSASGQSLAGEAKALRTVTGVECCRVACTIDRSTRQLADAFRPQRSAVQPYSGTSRCSAALRSALPLSAPSSQFAAPGTARRSTHRPGAHPGIPAACPPRSAVLRPPLPRSAWAAALGLGESRGDRSGLLRGHSQTESLYLLPHCSEGGFHPAAGFSGVPTAHHHHYRVVRDFAS